MVRRTLRAAAWGAKGVLLLVALGALFAWPWSVRRPGGIAARHWSVETDRGILHRLCLASADGRVGIGWFHASFTNDALSHLPYSVESTAPGWSSLEVSRRWSWRLAQQGNGWGPLAWSFEGSHDEDEASTWRSLSLPLWLLASLAGAWPLASLALLLRRRRQTRRRAAANRCRHCGYDLRATPSMCPECGQTATHS